jgi:hypothetical protein
LSFTLVDSSWKKVFERELATDHNSVRIVCPFIKRGTIEKMLAARRPKKIQVITRFNLNEFFLGVNDVSALAFLLDLGADIKGIRHLHAKMYLFGSSSAIAGSANLTDRALSRNHEFGFVTNDERIVGECRSYFDRMWREANAIATSRDLEVWRRKLNKFKLRNPKAIENSDLGDYGTDLGIEPDETDVPTLARRLDGRAFVKFLGKGDNRASHSMPVIDEIEGSECHWSVAYPKGRRPKQVDDGATVYLGRLVDAPTDILIFGRAIGRRHRRNLDDASPAEIGRLGWKRKWPHYVRLDDVEFVAGSMSNGVSLDSLMRALGKRSFASTMRNAKKGSGNTNPRKAYRQQPAVELSPEAAAWLDARLTAALQLHGQIPASVLSSFPGPSDS